MPALTNSIKALPLVGDTKLSPSLFSGLDPIFTEFQTRTFLSLRAKRRFHLINLKLLELIQKSQPPCFLLPAVLNFIDRVNKEEILQESYRLMNFEFWLNHFSLLTPDENYDVRARIVGKKIPRNSYQKFFPIGMGKKFPNTHYVSAHTSPDVDTTVASFIGWLDAFGAQVSEGLHIWSLPGGPPDSHIKTTFANYFGGNAFNLLIRASGHLSLTSIDLITQKGLKKTKASTPTSSVNHGSSDEAVIFIDDDGFYLGDWRTYDVEGTRRIISNFNACLRWFENNLHSRLISIFTKVDLNVSDLPDFRASLFDFRISDCEPVQDFTELQKKQLHDYLKKVLKIPTGLDCTFHELANTFSALNVHELSNCYQAIALLEHSNLFNKEGFLEENRPKIFHKLEELFTSLDKGIVSIRNYTDRFDMMMAIKRKVLNRPSEYITLRSEVAEIRAKMKNFESLTVVIPERDGKVVPVGIVKASDIRNATLGTVSLRDFCNTNEISLEPYLSVISVIDHHKSSLTTLSPPLALIGDVQSCNILIAEQAFLINDQFGNTTQKIPPSLFENTANLSPSQARLLQRKLLKQMNEKENSDCFIHKDREYLEYLFFLYAILDDTDLLTKVSDRDVECVVQLLNRLKSLSVGEDVEALHTDHIPRNSSFAKNAAMYILQNDDMYSLYKTIYSFKEQEHEKHLELAAKGKPSNLFDDTKEQNGCSKVGQTKLFASNFQVFKKDRSAIREQWLKLAQSSYQVEPSIDLHIHMISTITGADEVYQGKYETYYHHDEMWIWPSPKQTALDHLADFLSAFNECPEVKSSGMTVSFLGDNAHELEPIFTKNLTSAFRISADSMNRLPIAVLKFKPGAINSRKSMITPFLPLLVS